MAVLTVDIASEDIHYPLKIEKGLLNHLAKEIKKVSKNKKISIIFINLYLLHFLTNYIVFDKIYFCMKLYYGKVSRQ